jgi:LmbE family N-acetylglucosaminyl deacetylase
MISRVTTGRPLSHDRSVQLNLPTPARALAIVAHPDDAEFQCGATFAKWADQGCIINHLVCTVGAKGTWDPHADTRALVATR